jgi:transposase
MRDAVRLALSLDVFAHHRSSSSLERRFREWSKEEGHDENYHQVIWAVPYSPQLMPIEELWGIVKRSVAKNHTTDRNIDDLKRHVQQSFDSIEASTCEGLIRRSVQELEDVMKKQELFNETSIAELGQHTIDASTQSSNLNNDLQQLQHPLTVYGLQAVQVGASDSYMLVWNY